MSRGLATKPAIGAKVRQLKARRGGPAAVARAKPALLGRQGRRGSRALSTAANDSFRV